MKLHKKDDNSIFEEWTDKTPSDGVLISITIFALLLVFAALSFEIGWHLNSFFYSV